MTFYEKLLLFFSSSEGLELLMTAIEKVGFKNEIKLGMDVAASEFYKNGRYDLNFKSKEMAGILLFFFGCKVSSSSFLLFLLYFIYLFYFCLIGKQTLSGEELADLYREFIRDFPIVSIEDPFDQVFFLLFLTMKCLLFYLCEKDDWESYSKFVANCSEQIVGDDLLVSILATFFFFKLLCPLIPYYSNKFFFFVPMHTFIFLFQSLDKVTNPQRIDTAIKKKACTGLLLKVCLNVFSLIYTIVIHSPGKSNRVRH